MLNAVIGKRNVLYKFLFDIHYFLSYIHSIFKTWRAAVVGLTSSNNDSNMADDIIDGQHDYSVIYGTLANFLVEKKIGKGQFSEVYKAKCSIDTVTLALKKVQVRLLMLILCYVNCSEKFLCFCLWHYPGFCVDIKLMFVEDTMGITIRISIMIHKIHVNS